MPENPNMMVGEVYASAYGEEEFASVYLRGRNRVYERIGSLIQDYGINFVVDVGCSFGLLVESLNQRGIDAFGVELDIPELRAKHAELQSAKKFYYGDAENFPVPVPARGSAIVYVDTLRYIAAPRSLFAEYIVVKEVGTGVWARYLRRNAEDLKRRSPQDLLGNFPGYQMERLWSTRDIWGLSSPGLLARYAINQFPTYTAMLKRKC